MGDTSENKLKKHICIGILAHVDAGKTTFSEQLLYHTHQIRTLGRVDNGTASLDLDEMERARGITIFADQTVFPYKEDIYYLIDTPGHMDFSAETERTLQALDYGILLIGGMAGVQSHTSTLFHLLERYQIPSFFFLNKCDMDGFQIDTILQEIRQKLTSDLFYLSETTTLEEMAEAVAERDEAFIQPFLEESYTREEVILQMQKLIQSQRLFLAFSGSALKDKGIDFFLEQFSQYTPARYSEKADHPLSALVYKIRHDNHRSRITFLKLLSGTLHVKDNFFLESGAEKINEIRIYHGGKYTTCKQASAGDIVAVTGLKTPVCGSMIGTERVSMPSLLTPALQSKAVISDSINIKDFLTVLRLLEAEEPTLCVEYLEEQKEIRLHIMGAIQLEILKQLILKRFGMEVFFQKPEVLYQETIQEPIMGYGHFEPLRHYAEVNLRLEPSPRGSGISFSSECHVDTLSIQYQNLIRTHIFEKVHRGILTGSRLTDVQIVLTAGKAHIKHTEGGDFREATYQAVRQGLEKAHNILLEPYYRFEIQTDSSYLGKILSDLQKYNCDFDPPQTISSPCGQTALPDSFLIKGCGPVSTLMDYPAELTASTKGTGSISMVTDSYRICHNTEEVIAMIGYKKERDLDNPSGSVFCAKGAGFSVPWDEAEEYMHCI